ncbi:two-pore potassium channel 4 [Raphanus sativus]|uniref:Two-pore potassium channel 4 n=1 Tax=Raphanus sativus TaxID=3726 RepID=A0A9W3BRE0_RAPSA|nr:two-pore potassium channel 4 [Raphanus sativus]
MGNHSDLGARLLTEEHLRTESPSTGVVTKKEDITEEEDVPKETSREGATAPEIPPTAVPTVYKPIITVAVILLCVYLTFAVTTYTLLPEEFTGTKTNLFVDALYFAVVTLSTVGYGDIVPSSTRTKILNIVLVSIGVFSLDYLMNRVVIHLLDLQEKAILARIKTPSSVVVDEVKGRIRTEFKLCLAILAVVLCVGVGTLFLHYHENLDLIDSVYLSVISIGTVGYGDEAFQTVYGRVFALVWILMSGLAVTTFFYYFAQTRIGGSIMQLPESMSESKTRIDKAEFILWKLKEDKTITEEDIRRVLEGCERSG